MQEKIFHVFRRLGMGPHPNLARLDPAGNPNHTVDDRSVYATVLDRWLQADADEVLGARYERLSLL